MNSETEINLPDLSGERLWTVADVARYLSMSTSWVYQRSADGTLPRLNIGGALRFDPDEIRAFARGERQPAPIDIGSRRRQRGGK